MLIRQSGPDRPEEATPVPAVVSAILAGAGSYSEWDANILIRRENRRHDDSLRWSAPTRR